MHRACSILFHAALALAAPASAQDEGAQGPPELSGPWERAHTLNLDGSVLHYRSLLDHVVLRDEKGAATAELWHIAYFRVDADGERDPTRPLIFAYNGGPGSAS